MSADFAARALARRALKAVGDTQGADAYEVAVAEGFVGSRQSWLASLKGEDGVGTPGKDAYQVALDAGFLGSRAAWLASLKGDDGVGDPGKDAYQVAVDAGFVGNRAAWLASLQGPPGQDVDPATLAELQDSLATALERLAVLESPDTLGPLALEPSSIPEDAAPGELIGHLAGMHPFEQLTVVDDAGGRLAYDDGAVLVGDTPLDGLGGSVVDLVLQRRLAKPGKPAIEVEATLAISVTEAAGSPVVSNFEELRAALDVLAPHYDGTILLSSTGVFPSNQTLSNLRSSGKLILKGESATARTVFRTITLSNCKSLRLENLDTGDSSTFSDSSCIRGSAASDASPCEDIEIVNCIGYGGSLDPIRNVTEPLAVAPTLRHGITGVFNGLHIEDCHFDNLNNVYKPGSISKHFRVIKSTGRNIYSDFISFGVAPDMEEIVFKDNFATQFVGRGADLGGDGPHCDFIQFIEGEDARFAQVVIVEGNIYVAGEARGSAQVLFGPKPDRDTRLRAKIFDNMSIVREAEQQSPGSGGHDGSLASRWLTYREQPGVHVGTNQSRIDTSPVAESAASAFVDSVGESFGGANGTIREGNYLLPNTLEAYQAAFEGPFTGPAPTTRAGWAARYRAKEGGPLAELRDTYDYVNGVRLKEHRPVVDLRSVVDQELDVDYETPPLLVLGSAEDIPYSVPVGVECRSAPTADELAAAAYSSAAGTVAPGQFIQLKVRTANTISNPVECAISLGDHTYSRTVTTRSALVFPVVDNADLAWSRLNTPPPPASGQKKLLLGLRAKLDSMAAFEQIFSTGAGTILRMSIAAGNKVAFRMITAGTLNATSIQEMDTAWRTHVIALDLTPEAAALGPGAVFRWWRDGVLQEVTGTINTTGSAVFNPESLFGNAGGNFALFRNGDGTSGNADGQLAFMWADWGDASYVIPDFSDPLAYARWSADDIDLADGSGPTGAPPLLFFSGPAGEWNDPAGIANKGTLGPSYRLVKQAGEYV